MFAIQNRCTPGKLITAQIFTPKPFVFKIHASWRGLQWRTEVSWAKTNYLWCFLRNFNVTCRHPSAVNTSRHRNLLACFSQSGRIIALPRFWIKLFRSQSAAASRVFCVMLAWLTGKYLCFVAQCRILVVSCGFPFPWACLLTVITSWVCSSAEKWSVT